MRDARAGVTHTDARRDTDVDVAPHARAGVARERASRPGACAVARPFRGDPVPRAPRDAESRITSSDRPFSPRPSGGARAPDPRVQRPHPRPHFFGSGVDGAVPAGPRGRSISGSEPRLSRDGGRALRRAKSPPPRRTSRSTSALVRVDRLNASPPRLRAAQARRRTRRRRAPAPYLARRPSAPAPRPRTAPSSAPPPPPSTPNSSNPRLRRKRGARFVRWARRSSC